MATEKPVSLKNLTLLGKEHLPSSGGFLIVPSQLNYNDLLRLELLLEGREVVYLVEHGAAFAADLKEHLERDQIHSLVIVPDTTDVSAFQSSIQDQMRKNAVVIYIPTQAATLPSPLTTVPGAKLEFLLKSQAPMIPLFVLHWGDVALPIERTYDTDESVFAFGTALQGADLTLANYQEQLLGLSDAAFSKHEAMNLHLAYALLLGLKKHGGRNVVIDGKDEKNLRFDTVLATAIVLSKVIKAETNKERVGIILPPGLGGLIANVAVLLAGKIPVNLNFTAGRVAVEHSIKAGNLDRFITADIFVRKMQSFPWPPTKQLMLVERILPKLKLKIGLWLGLSKLLPAALLAAVLGVPKKGGDKEALLLFTSGSSGAPKGVVLTHRNLLANVIQFSSRLNLNTNDGILGCLPLFHSFGCTVTLWYPLISGLHLVTYPSPIESKKLAELVEKYRVSLMIATPTFLRGFLRGVNREQLASLKVCVTGAEKLPATVATAFETRFGKKVYEGYGLTETSPASNVNLPDPAPLGSAEQGYAWLPSHRPGSVGQVLPGMAVRITHPDTGAPLPIHSSGMIWFKGANVFGGYLNDAKRTAEVIDENGWFKTGDVGRMDMDGFLYIEGRLSRFSKIAGEMVPHETVEDALTKAMGLENETMRKIAVVGVPDVDKGEALILLTAIPGGPENQEILDLRYRLLEKGLPPLWIPKKMIRVNEIPVLASGKLDVQSCEKVAKGGS